MIENLCILGSTGSVGKQALEVVREHSDFRVCSLACATNVELLNKQIREFNVKKVCIYDKNKYSELKALTSDLILDIHVGMDGLNELAGDKNLSMVLNSVTGMIGIEPTISAIKSGNDIALANKETLVAAGDIIMTLAKEKTVNIYPVDSEHSAIYQCLRGRKREEVSKIILTASGGPFRGKKLQDLEKVTLKEALNHPNWSMGAKITIDSATMINKGLEVIEAARLFDIGIDNIEVVVHPQSIIHSMVEFKDGAVIAQLGPNSMKVPIQYALYRGNRENLNVDRLNFFDISRLDFEKVDFNVFKGLKIFIDALRVGGTMPTAVNVANEIAVAKFLNNEIRFLDITSIVEEVYLNHNTIKNPNLNDIFNTEEEIRKEYGNIK